jgi:hypothetical protein
MKTNQLNRQQSRLSGCREKVDSPSRIQKGIPGNAEASYEFPAAQGKAS